jgi:hypothetical protein
LTRGCHELTRVWLETDDGECYFIPSEQCIPYQKLAQKVSQNINYRIWRSNKKLHMLKFNVIVDSSLDGIFNALEIDLHYDPHPLLRSERQSLKMDKTSGNKYCWSMKEIRQLLLQVFSLVTSRSDDYSCEHERLEYGTSITSISQ